MAHRRPDRPGDRQHRQPRNLDLEPLNLAPGTVVHAEVRDPVGPNGIDWVRNPSTNNSATDSGLQRPALRADAHVDGR